MHTINMFRSGPSLLDKTASIFVAIAMIASVFGSVAFVFPQNVSAATTLLSESFGSSSSNDISGWEEEGNENDSSTKAEASSGSGNDSVSPNGGAFAKIAEDEWICVEVDAGGYESLLLSYYWRGDSDSEGAGSGEDDGLVEYRTNGSCSSSDSGWTTLQDHDMSVDSSWSTQSAFSLPEALGDSEFFLRFRADSTADDEYFRVDGISLTGEEIDATAPTLAEVTPVTTPTNDSTPNYTFSSTEAGTITYSGDCSSVTTAAVSGSNAITFTSLSDGTHSNCQIKVTDASGNESSALSVSAFTVDTNAPVITLTGSASISLTVGDTYSDAGATASDAIEGDLTTNVVTVNPVNTAVPGTYTITYDVSDSVGNAATQVIRTVTVSDESAPVVTVTPSTQTLEATGSTGAAVSFSVSAIDDVDGDITASSTCSVASGSTFVLGSSAINCQAVDSSSNTGFGAATVIVVDTTAPVITLAGSVSIALTVGDSYSDAGATASDIVDGDLTGDIAVVNPVNTSVAGTYTVTFNVSDEAENDAIEVTRTVVVQAIATPDVDLCSNLDGLQASVPEGYTANQDGTCTLSVTPPTDVCSNVEGNQSEVPSGMHSVGENECVNDEVTPPPPSNGGGNGPPVGSFSPGQVLGAWTGPSGEVLGASTSACNDVLLTDYMRRGKKNNPEQVKILQQFLNDEMKSNLPITGVFGSLTENAVKAFQKKYASDVLDPWKITDPTGFVYKTTIRKINQIHCEALNIPIPTDLTPWVDGQ